MKYLQCVYDSRQSFCQKATIEDNKLYSYNTLVAYIKNNQLHIINTQSQTTRRHIKEFALQNGFKLEKIEKGIFNK